MKQLAPGPAAPIKGQASQTLRAVDIGFFRVLLTIPERILCLPRNMTMPKAACRYHQSISLQA